jgi:hypothetical protein
LTRRHINIAAVLHRAAQNKKKGLNMSLELVETTLTVAGGPLTPPLTANLKATYLKIWGELMGSSKAQEILSFLNSSAALVGVLIVDGGSDSLHMAPSAMAGGTAAKYTGGVAVVNINTPMKIKGTDIPLGVSLLHELGHAKQAIENAIWYEDLYSKILQNNVRAAKGLVSSERDAFVLSDARVTGATGNFGAKRKVREAVAAEWEAQFGNGPRRTLENDNLAKHEKPVLVELGLPFRDDYFTG